MSLKGLLSGTSNVVLVMVKGKKTRQSVEKMFDRLGRKLRFLLGIV